MMYDERWTMCSELKSVELDESSGTDATKLKSAELNKGSRVITCCSYSSYLLTYYFTIGVFSEREVIYIKSIFLILYKVRVSPLSTEREALFENSK